MEIDFNKFCDSTIFDYDNFYKASIRANKLTDIMLKYKIDCSNYNYYRMLLALHDASMYFISDKITELKEKIKNDDNSNADNLWGKLYKLQTTAISMDIFKRIYNEDESVYDDIFKHNCMGLAVAPGKGKNLFDFTVFIFLLLSELIDEIPDKIVDRINKYLDEAKADYHYTIEDFKELLEEE